ncbi:high frequency lysogenization protein HflD [Buchnera aphidicola]|uniref:high frequency lysogenization protein HflD n=1 Tax=Buchnera aphidicola TaxID=9 RepID=UPI0021C8DFB8|nr:high frequency lysogenization protein HflD [Buchnera aphidicola]
MINKNYSITLSLAGLCQSVYLVQELAQLGKCNECAFEVCLKSILDIQPISVIKIYGNCEKNICLGLEVLISILTFSNFSKSGLKLIKYILRIMILEEKLKKNSKVINILKKKISQISHQLYVDNINIDILTTKIAELYIEIFSNLGPRIEIKGAKCFLEDLKIQQKIRCLLFSGIRSLFLWKQLGGNKFKLFFFRNKIIKQAQKILSNF